jgi:hypothetical protein
MALSRKLNPTDSVGVDENDQEGERIRGLGRGSRTYCGSRGDRQRISTIVGVGCAPTIGEDPLGFGPKGWPDLLAAALGLSKHRDDPSLHREQSLR